MAAPHSVDPAGMLEQHLASASPDLLREMITSFARRDDVRAGRSGLRGRLRPRRGRARCFGSSLLPRPRFGMRACSGGRKALPVAHRSAWCTGSGPL